MAEYDSPAEYDPPNEGLEGLQDKYAPNSICFGCGPANLSGLKIKSVPQGDGVEAEWTAEPKYEAFPGMLNGGIIGALLDCHSNWSAAWHLMKQAGLDHPPCTVTAEYSIKLLKPTPTNRGPLKLFAHVVESKGDRAVVEATLAADGRVCATCRGTFVAVKPGHPAYHRW
jgi:acyl-coenzyme A thioesterase PaaI-like protein